ncbi:4-hydroxy-tetrahydrodipicolinate synthase [compost metagenome]
MLTGEDINIFTNLALGGAGAISASAHVRADLYVQVMQEMDRGGIDAARAMFYRLLPWIQMAFSEANPAVIKAALNTQGLIAHELREPMQACSAVTVERLRSVLQNLAA